MALTEETKKKLLDYKKNQATKPIKKNEPSVLVNLSKEITKSIAKPFLRTGLTAVQGAKAQINLGKALADTIKGDKKGASQSLSKASRSIGGKVILPFFGEVKPINVKGGLVSNISDIGSVGLDIGSNFVGGGSAGKAGKQVIKDGLGQAFKTGAKTAVLPSFGLAVSDTLEKKGSGKKISFGDEVVGIGAKTLGGTALGGLIGGGVGLAGKVAKKTISDVSDFLPKKIIEAPKTKMLIDTIKKEELAKEIQKKSIPKYISNISKRVDDSSAKDFSKIIDQSIALQSNPNAVRPLEITAGKQINKGLEEILGLKKRAGQEIGKVEKYLMENKDVIDLTDVSNKFVKKIQNNGVKIGQNGKLNFNGSSIPDTKDREIIEKIFNYLRPDKKGEVKRNASSALRFRTKTLAEEKLYKAKNELTKGEGLMSSVDSALLKKIGAIKEVGKDYFDNSVKYAKTSRVINDFKKIMGDEFTDDDLVKGKLGEFSRKLINRNIADTRGKIKQLYDVLGQYNPKINPNREVNKISDYAVFSNYLENELKVAPKSSAVNVVEEGSKKALEYATQPQVSFTRDFLNAGLKLFSQNPELEQKQKIELLKKILKIKK